jgi:2-octaprenyl-6-methoxyphenol hydroxylase
MKRLKQLLKSKQSCAIDDDHRIQASLINMHKKFDITIVGAGPVGMSLAALLLQLGVSSERILLIDAKPESASLQDPRSLALAAGSKQILDALQSWPSHATSITQIHVSRRGSFGRTLIKSDDYALPALGYVCRYGDVIASLLSTLQHHGVDILRPVSIKDMQEFDSHITLTLDDDSTINTTCLIQAEGGVFGSQPTQPLYRDYQQSAIVTHVHCSAPIAGRAYERFTSEGPFALLPQDEGYALVWCARPETVTHLLNLSDAEFLLACQKTFGDRLGQFTKTAARISYVLGLNAHPASTARSVAIGNAAQTLHPVAGQGLNLGLRDAAVLARFLARDCTPTSLSQFIQSRKHDRKLTIHLTDVMARVFASSPDHSWTQTLLGLGLGGIDAIKPVKKHLAEQMMFGWRG